ncbi:endonuclease/exonuclease/phosphatase (EEP) superfamily protein YafD [Chryseobacterium ginsenosidimutans]|uniref:endonuclease/exonuclease/phosphatase family protein n=1 Tax=Chryseobacterium ginsenosidimutans TaxID=687846 RepID=UPI00277E89D5|nr:endonuclease/exonuclease/phosphatase family protein [Chryseobacterium ginsenosidimutans]MDQ0592169.1 endonuclease/exonuclease/phosphatase (EEP) superfamily protein YafD [Chryseobacterium ginsenosidimutans]
MKIIRLILLILHVGIFFLLVGMLLNAYIPPKVFPWFNLLSLGFPLLMTGYILLTFFWIISWKKRAFLFLFLGLLFFNPILRWVNYSGHKSEEGNFKIISLNAKNGNLGVKNIETFINAQKADVVLLQEYGGYKEYHFDGLKRVADTAVVAVFSKFKIVGQKKLIKSNIEHSNIYTTQTDIEVRGKIYRIINIHLQSFKFEKSMVKLNGNNEKDEEKVKNIVKRLIPTFKIHQEQISVIKKAVENSPYPIILAGDFNSVPNSYEYYHLLGGLQDAFVKAGNGSATSFHDYKFPIRIDYIFTSKSIKPITYKVDRSVRISDHYPVIATFKLSK